ncbi:hypothetical protein Tco_1456132 [Tanacetum coccineum]
MIRAEKDRQGRNVYRVLELPTSDEEEEELSEHPPYNKYGFVDHPQLQMEGQRNKPCVYSIVINPHVLDDWEALEWELSSTSTQLTHANDLN